jgi:hypothetical protein
MTPEQIAHNFKYHPPVGNAAEAHMLVRAKAKELANAIAQLVPANAGREKALAITKCEEAMMWACAGIARHSNENIPPQPPKKGVGIGCPECMRTRNKEVELHADFPRLMLVCPECKWEIESDKVLRSSADISGSPSLTSNPSRDIKP